MDLGNDFSDMALAEQSNEYLRSIVDTIREPLLVLDEQLRVLSAGRSFYQLFQVTPVETERQLIYELGHGQWDLPVLRKLLEEILPHNSEFSDFEVTHCFPMLGKRTFLLNARKIFRPGNGSRQILLAFEDVTERRAVEDRREAAYQRERAIAEVLQRPLKNEIPGDSFPSLTLATLYEPARRNEADVGGDFFDAFALPQERVGLAVGDASGKGLTAAARAMQVKDVLRALALADPHAPGHILARLNDFVYETRLEMDQREGFVCLALAVLDRRRGEGTLVTAGAEPPLLLRENGQLLSLYHPCPPLGIDPQIPYTAQTFRLEPGDTLAMLTDGLTEAQKGRELFGYERVSELLQRHQTAPTLREQGLAVLAAARDFAEGKFQDDVCLLLARREPGGKRKHSARGHQPQSFHPSLEKEPAELEPGHGQTTGRLRSGG